MRRTRKCKRGGGISDTLSSWGNSLSQSASSLWQKTKSGVSSLGNSATGSTGSTGITSSTMTGGRRRHRRHRRHGRSMRMRKRKTHRRKFFGLFGGDFMPNISASGVAKDAADFMGAKTAQPSMYVGGRRRKSHRRSRRHR